MFAGKAYYGCPRLVPTEAGLAETHRLESFGTRLKQRREERGMTLDQAAFSTKIGTRFLRALEEERFDQLPGGIFNKGFIRAYARCLGLDEGDLVANYLAITGEAHPAVEEELPKQFAARTPIHVEAKPALRILGVIALILLVVLAVHEFRSRQRSVLGAAQISAPTRAASPTKALSSSPFSLHTANHPAPSVPRSTANASEPSLNPQAMAGSFVVKIKVSDECWISIETDGKDAGEEMLEAGTEKSIQAAKKIVIKAGNVGGLDFFFNGHELPSQGHEEEVKTLTFDANGLQVTSNH